VSLLLFFFKVFLRSKAHAYIRNETQLVWSQNSEDPLFQNRDLLPTAEPCLIRWVRCVWCHGHYVALAIEVLSCECFPDQRHKSFDVAFYHSGFFYFLI
jgi:hypothetical protein